MRGGSHARRARNHHPTPRPRPWIGPRSLRGRRTRRRAGRRSADPALRRTARLHPSMDLPFRDGPEQCRLSFSQGRHRADRSARPWVQRSGSENHTTISTSTPAIRALARPSVRHEESVSCDPGVVTGVLRQRHDEWMFARAGVTGITDGSCWLRLQQHPTRHTIERIGLASMTLWPGRSRRGRDSGALKHGFSGLRLRTHRRRSRAGDGPGAPNVLHR